ncbi:GTP-binding protein A [Favolaschia claudopus]|uniref:GTP-binding protein A n=1 Tax=Favolaschia claudopus TaxID=2862362 RepID=A0AAW0A1Z2_9AGAR
MAASDVSSLVHDELLAVAPGNDHDVPVPARPVLGDTGAGKTEFINLASGSNLTVGRGLESCTSKVRVAPRFWLDGRLVTLIDTPGFNDTNKSDADILKEIAAFLAASYKHGMRLAGIIYMHRISDNRMGGVARRHFKMFRELCGESTLKNVAIVTSMWGQDDLQTEEAREELMRHYRTTECAHAILHSLFGNRPRALQIQRELVDEHKDISQTAAGEELNRETAAKIKRQAEELAELRQQMEDAIRAKDEQWKAELRQRYLSELQDQSKKLVSDYARQQEVMEAKIAGQAEKEKLNAEAAEREYQDRMKELEARFRTAAEAEKQEMDAKFTTLQKEALERQIRNSSSVPDLGFFGNLAEMVNLVAAIQRVQQSRLYDLYE